MSDRRLAKEGRRLYDLYQSKGKFGLETVVNELLRYVNQNPDVLNPQKICHDQIKSIDESVRLRPDRQQLDLWPEEDLKKTIPTGTEGERIEWGKAKEAEIDGWDREDTANFLKQVTAYETARILREIVRKQKNPNETVAQFYARMRKKKAQTP